MHSFNQSKTLLWPCQQTLFVGRVGVAIKSEGETMLYFVIQYLKKMTQKIKLDSQIDVCYKMTDLHLLHGIVLPHFHIFVDSHGGRNSK